ncbi:hypothetical protein H2509_13990 [Stappia sp. F7233]|uniref:Uncharacterized protein n=1 Tax=Stappia albiluteola TaxID=2758565 RepID=A0A839AGG5_9HYPH|nr:hypothetical protein [Stappia albiluteola]MBA5778235.1 hypothetical protein [Stappia albiluteola]
MSHSSEFSGFAPLVRRPAPRDAVEAVSSVIVVATAIGILLGETVYAAARLAGWL